MKAIWNTLTPIQRIALIVLLVAAGGSFYMALMAAVAQNWLLLLSWLTVILGIALTWLDLGAVEYFRHQERLAGRSWLLRVFTRTAMTVTVVCAWITTARVATLLFGGWLLIPILTGILIVWLMLIPILMRHEFEDHEGR